MSLYGEYYYFESQICGISIFGTDVVNNHLSMEILIQSVVDVIFIINKSSFIDNIKLYHALIYFLKY